MVDQALESRLEEAIKMEAIWLKHYPPGIPAEVDVHEFASLSDTLLRSCQRYGELLAADVPSIQERLSRPFERLPAWPARAAARPGSS